MNRYWAIFWMENNWRLWLGVYFDTHPAFCISITVNRDSRPVLNRVPSQNKSSQNFRQLQQLATSLMLRPTLLCTDPGKIYSFSTFFSLQQMHCMGLTSSNESLHCKVSKNTTQSIAIPLLFAQAFSVPFHAHIPNEARKLNGSGPSLSTATGALRWASRQQQFKGSHASITIVVRGTY